VVVWRISNYADLSGIGGMLVSARWHSIGRPIVYTSEHPALAMLETLVHLDRDNLPSRFQLLTVEFPDNAIINLSDSIPAEVVSSESWQRNRGDTWLAQKESLVLRVPSVIIPYSWNYLLNPAHERVLEARISRVDSAPFDVRLK